MPEGPVILKEFPVVGPCRVRLLKSSPRSAAVLDIREFAKGPSFEGFTRRGIRITSLAEARLLREALEAVEKDGLLKEA